jgi:hypothetical protein
MDRSNTVTSMAFGIPVSAALESAGVQKNEVSTGRKNCLSPQQHEQAR